MSAGELAANPFRRLKDLSASETEAKVRYSTTIEEVGSIVTPSFETADPKIYNLNLHGCLDQIRPVWAGPYPPARVTVYRIEDCFSVGQGLLLDHSFRPIRAFLSQHTEQDIESACSAAYAYFMSGDMEFVEDEAMVLIKPGYGNYGHWLTELLVQPIILRQVSPGARPLMFVCDHAGALMDLYRDTLKAAGVQDDSILTYNFVPKLMKAVYVVVGHCSHGAYMSPAVLTALDACRAGPAFGRRSKGRRRRIYVQRGERYLRRVANEQDVLKVIERHGFDVVDTGLMSFSDQVEAFSDCELTVGVAGAGLTNICWQPRGTACIGLYPASMPDTFFWWICQHRGIRFADIRCPIPTGDSWNDDIDVPVRQLDEAIERALSGRI